MERRNADAGDEEAQQYGRIGTDQKNGTEADGGDAGARMMMIGDLMRSATMPYTGCMIEAEKANTAAPQPTWAKLRAKRPRRMASTAA